MGEPRTFTLTGHATTEQKRTYLGLPFDVPPGTTRIEVAYRYSDRVGSDPWLTDGNTVDLGLIDGRGANFGAMGFRGWSGSARDAIFVSDTDATPGYLAGNLAPGSWQVLLGFYKIAPQGCGYEVTITLEFGPHPVSIIESDSKPPAAVLPLRPDGWYRGELHCHTVHSDGDSTVAEVLAEAARLDLDFLAITDHNAYTQYHDLLDAREKLNLPLAVIPGCEMTTYYGHWNVWGLRDWVEFRIETPEQMRVAMREAQSRGGLVSCNHPRDYGPPWEFVDVTDYHCLEVWNGSWVLNNWQSREFLVQQLNAGRRLVLVGGSDMHRLKGQPGGVVRLGTPTTWLYLGDQTPTETNILAALRVGHCFLTEAPDGPRLFLEVDGAMMGESVRRSAENSVKIRVEGAGSMADNMGSSIAGGKLVMLGSSGERFACTVDADPFTLEMALDCTGELYLRAELHTLEPDVDGHPVLRALTNPVYFA